MKKIYIVVRHWTKSKNETIVCAYENHEKAMKRVEIENQTAFKLFHSEDENNYYAYIAERNLYI